ncbi:MAG: hypothetical protein ACLT98_07020 [Eggerthellaceae bacterium]
MLHTGYGAIVERANGLDEGRLSAALARLSDYVPDLLSGVEGLTTRKGEYLLYSEGTLFGGARYDDRRPSATPRPSALRATAVPTRARGRCGSSTRQRRLLVGGGRARSPAARPGPADDDGLRPLRVARARRCSCTSACCAWRASMRRDRCGVPN